MTPNPALDLTYEVPGIKPGASHRVPPPFSRAGGKGLNVARVAHQLGYPVMAVVPFGGHTGDSFIAELRSSGLPHRPVAIAGETRRSIALMDTDSGLATVFNEEGPSLQPGEWRALAAAVVDVLGVSGDLVPGVHNVDDTAGGQAGVLVGAGSLPLGAPGDFYPALVRLAHDVGVPAVVDTSGSALLDAARAGADLLKPNHHELREATGEDELHRGARNLIAQGARMVLVSAGADGMSAFHRDSPDGYFTARLPQPLEGNPTGAGDAAVSAAAVALAAGITDPPEILRRASAWSAAAVLMPVAGEVSARLDMLEEQLVITWEEDTQ
ncbi:hexose kinase [Arthrobacter sp. ISL-30]|uniref:1-phosphofructokinase family hexose kinase n=1 Tax=Arthrobacter sp. ISL-30 TaxID=2819109 RepID=UPI0027DFBD23|nr:hexose kinase [Arthrobacter sp. ISL-30]